MKEDVLNSLRAFKMFEYCEWVLTNISLISLNMEVSHIRDPFVVISADPTDKQLWESDDKPWKLATTQDKPIFISELLLDNVAKTEVLYKIFRCLPERIFHAINTNTLLPLLYLHVLSSFVGLVLFRKLPQDSALQSYYHKIFDLRKSDTRTIVSLGDWEGNGKKLVRIMELGSNQMYIWDFTWNQIGTWSWGLPRWRSGTWNW